MLRRTGQQGNVFQHSQPWSSTAPAYGRFWIDTPGEPRQRKTVALGICRTPSVAKQKLREYIDTQGINSKQSFYENTSPALTFRAQSAAWMQSLRTRRRRPVKPATLHNWQNCLDKWLLPALGDMSLAQVGNSALRTLVDKMQTAGLSPKSIVNYSQVVKLVVASALNAEGEQLYLRKWNHDFIGMPVVLESEQRRPTLTAEQVSAIVAGAAQRYRVLFALLAGTGLRIGEALALKATDFSSDFKTLSVQRALWRGREQSPKTPSAVRTVDLHESLAATVRDYAEGKPGYLFTSSTGRPLIQRNVLHVLHAAIGKVGLHAFRRFRASMLRKARVPEDLIGLWLGHAGRSVTDTYARQLRDDVSFRQEWAGRAGLGYIGLQTVAVVHSQEAA